MKSILPQHKFSTSPTDIEAEVYSFFLVTAEPSSLGMSERANFTMNTTPEQPETEQITKTCNSSQPCCLMDDDLNEELGTPACDVEGGCESCQ